MKPILVLGMHRNESTLTRALHCLGASLGRSGSIGKSCVNEPLRLVNEELLEALGGGWECPPVMAKGWTRGPATQLVTPARARCTLISEFGDAPVGVWMDARTSLTLPFWLPVFDEPPVVLFVHRHPSEVADSLAASNGLSRAHALAVWERFNHDALMHAAGQPMFAVGYQSIVEDPVGVTKRLVHALAEWGVELPNDPETTDMELPSRQRHCRVADEDRFDDPIATDEQRDLFRLLRRVDGASACVALPERLPAPNPISLELLALAGQARVARRDAMARGMAFEYTAGSRRRLVRSFLERTLPERVLPRTEVPVPKPTQNYPPVRLHTD